MTGRNRRVVMLVLAVMLVAVLSVMVYKRSNRNSPPSLKVTNGRDTITATQGSCIWSNGHSSALIVDTGGPLEMYLNEELASIMPDKDGYITLRFSRLPDSYSVIVYTEDDVLKAEHAFGTLLHASGNQLSIPDDVTWIVSVQASWKQGECYYCFYVKS